MIKDHAWQRRGKIPESGGSTSRVRSLIKLTREYGINEIFIKPELRAKNRMRFLCTLPAPIRGRQMERSMAGG